MPALARLLQGYKRFRHDAWQVDREEYERLGQGQEPGVMVIGCADSRVDPATIFDTVPGQTFVVRNVANLVPPYIPGGGVHGVSAALEFAVKSLNVKYILVMGHGGCGGIRASLQSATTDPVGEFVGPWVQLANGSRDKVIQDNPGADFETLAAKLELEGINGSIRNLMTFPFVREAVEAGDLFIHGGWFAIATGELHWRDPETGQFREVDTAAI